MTYLGLRPGEKLYEELLVKTEELDKTPNSMIFIERDTPLCEHDIEVKLEELKAACETEDDDVAQSRYVKSCYHTFGEVHVRWDGLFEVGLMRKLASGGEYKYKNLYEKEWEKEEEKLRQRK